MRASPSTLLRYVVRSSPEAAHPPPYAVGIDDFSFRRGHRYGSMIVDLERHEVIDLLEDREAGSVSAWLKRHPGIQVIARDRSGAYAEAAATSAPQAVQVADRWHLLSSPMTRASSSGSPTACRPAWTAPPPGCICRCRATAGTRGTAPRGEG